MYDVEVSEQLSRKFKKLGKKNRKLLVILDKKISQIVEDPYHFKPLCDDLKGTRRVHIDTSFVLIYEIDDRNNIIRLLDFAHHDKIYQQTLNTSR